MKQNDNNKQASEDFTVMSLSSAPNQNSQFAMNFQQQFPKKQSHCFIIGFVILGFYFLIFAIVQLSTNFNEIEYQIQLKPNGKQYVSRNTFVSFKDKTEVFIYLRMQHVTQLDYVEMNEFMDQCEGYMTNQEMGKTISIINTTLNPQDKAIPCGKYASFYPQGNLEIIDISDNKSIQIITKGIGPKDPPFLTNNIDPNKQWANFQNERYQNWMTPHTQEKVQKLWGKVYQVFSGNFQFKITVNNQMPKVNRILLFVENNQALSGYNNQLCYVNFFYAILVFIGALGNFLIQKKCSSKKLIKKKPITSVQSNQIKIFLNSAASTPAVKFD